MNMENQASIWTNINMIQQSVLSLDGGPQTLLVLSATTTYLLQQTQRNHEEKVMSSIISKIISLSTSF